MTPKKHADEEKTSVININDVFPVDSDSAGVATYYILKTVSGDNIGKIFTLEGSATVVGRGDACDIRLFSKSVSREHARFLLNDDNTVTLVDNDSTNGTFVNGFRIRSVLLKKHDTIRFGHALEFEILDEKAYLRELDSDDGDDGSHDALTGAYSKAHFTDEIEQRYSDALKSFHNLALLLVDIDNFKKTAESYGESGATCVVRETATRIKDNLRKYDYLSRYGYDQFALLLDDCSCAQARDVADRVRKLFHKRPFTCGGELINITVSIGVSTMDNESVLTGRDLLIQADKRLLEAKKAGGNTSR